MIRMQPTQVGAVSNVDRKRGSVMTSQELPVPPPPKNGVEHSDKEYNHETKAGQEDNKRARTASNKQYTKSSSGSKTD